MASVNEIGELIWLQLSPKAGDETAITREEVITAALNEAAYNIWLLAMAEKRDDGYFDVPSYLLKEVELPVINNEIDLCDMGVLRGLPKDIWLQNVGGLGCACEYVKTTMNLSQLLCDEEDRGHAYKTYVIVGKKIKFPQGVHATPLPITYATNGQGIDEDFEVSDEIAAIVRTRLLESYLGRIAKEDVTNNSNNDN